MARARFRRNCLGMAPRALWEAASASAGVADPVPDDGGHGVSSAGPVEGHPARPGLVRVRLAQGLLGVPEGAQGGLPVAEVRVADGRPGVGEGGEQRVPAGDRGGLCGLRRQSTASVCSPRWWASIAYEFQTLSSRDGVLGHSREVQRPVQGLWARSVCRASSARPGGGGGVVGGDGNSRSRIRWEAARSASPGPRPPRQGSPLQSLVASPGVVQVHQGVQARRGAGSRRRCRPVGAADERDDDGGGRAGGGGEEVPCASRVTPVRWWGRLRRRRAEAQLFGRTSEYCL